MTDGPMTATEVLARRDEAFKRCTSLTPNFSGVINAIFRSLKRAALRDALQGSREDRMRYCLERATAKPMIDLACYGTAVFDPNEISALATRWFLRLERLAERGVR